MKHSFSIVIVALTIFQANLAMHDIMSDIERRLCTVCNSFAYKKFSKLVLDNVGAEKYSCKPTESLVPGQLIIVKTDDNRWEPALYYCIPVVNQKMHTAHLCNNHNAIRVPSSHIRQLNLVHQSNLQPVLPYDILCSTLADYMRVFNRQETDPFFLAKVIKHSSKIIVIGDLHGSQKSLGHILNDLLDQHIIDENGKLQKDHYCVLTGDYTDRHTKGPGVWQLLMQLALINPHKLFLLRGNHETLTMAHRFNFFKEWKTSYKDGDQLEEQINSLKALFNTLAAGLVLGMHLPATTEKPYGTYRFLLFIHGGLDITAPVDLMIRKAIKNYVSYNKQPIVAHTYKNSHFEDSGVLWNDFFANTSEGQAPLSLKSFRGPTMRTFNTSAAYEFMENCSSNHQNHTFTLDAIFHGHQHVQGGISRLREVKLDNSDFEPLVSEQSILIDHPTVLTCISSPEGLGAFCCLEDSYAIINCDQEQLWRATPKITRRVPKKFAQLAQAADQ